MLENNHLKKLTVLDLHAILHPPARIIGIRTEPRVVNSYIYKTMCATQHHPHYEGMKEAIPASYSLIKEVLLNGNDHAIKKLR